ncbi:PGG domain containing protein, partial [Parasponia andersonii]
SFRNKMNNCDQTPEDLFTEEHRDLMKESEEWMKKNANVCLLVATLIVAVVFQAAFDVISNKENETVHVILFISNAIAMSASSTAIMLFLAILISRFTKREMFWALPCRFICGIISLFISVTFMMVSFCLATFLASKSSAIRSCTCILQALPILLFLYLVSPVLSDFIKTTFFSESAFKHRKPVLQYYDPRPEIRGPNNEVG